MNQIYQCQIDGDTIIAMAEIAAIQSLVKQSQRAKTQSGAQYILRRAAERTKSLAIRLRMLSGLDVDEYWLKNDAACRIWGDEP